MKLYEAKHAYYCNQGNYYSNECGAEYSSWADFIAEQGDSDLDMNLIFRWDWNGPTNDDGEPVASSKDPYYRDSKLLLFYLGQRKGIYRYVEIEVCQADEPAVKEWLQVRFDYLTKLWEPFRTTAETSGAIK